jgi:membrane protease YdiL (CAAX protease family)
MSRDEKRAALILAVIAGVEGLWCAMNARNPGKFLAYMGFSGARAPLAGWIVAAAVFLTFMALAARLPSVRANLVEPSLLKLLALAVAITACFLEEAVFRKALMDALQRGGHSAVIQVLVSGLCFGVAHGIWGLFRASFAAATGAIIATGLLGAGLAAAYIASDRILAPCVVAHFLINVFAEPGLVLAAVRGEMNGRH